MGQGITTTRHTAIPEADLTVQAGGGVGRPARANVSEPVPPRLPQPPLSVSFDARSVTAFSPRKETARAPDAGR
jgi:hypothetical protein